MFVASFPFSPKLRNQFLGLPLLISDALAPIGLCLSGECNASRDNEVLEHNRTLPHFHDPAKIYSRLAYLFGLIRSAGAGVVAPSL
jgi:hypothetical protein